MGGNVPNSKLNGSRGNKILCKCGKKWYRGERRLSDNKWDASCLWRPLQCDTVGNGTKIWSANLKPDTFHCLIFPIATHYNQEVADMCFTLTPLWGINQYFHTYCIWRAIGLNLRYANRPFLYMLYWRMYFSWTQKVTKMTHNVSSTVSFFSYAGLKRHDKIKQQFGRREKNQLPDSLLVVKYLTLSKLSADSRQTLKKTISYRTCWEKKTSQCATVRYTEDESTHRALILKRESVRALIDLSFAASVNSYRNAK